MAEYYPKGQDTPPMPVETNIWAIVSVISGVLGWLGLFGLGGIVAVIAGHVAKNQVRDSAGRMTGDGLATIGLVLGYTNIAVTAIGVCLLVLVMLGAITLPFVCIPFANEFNF